jgi:two-component system, chemotaxis family, CheB/CheR fusion protein
MRNNQRMLRVVWTEAGGPRAVKPTTSGFGYTLIESGIPGAHVAREYRPSGLVCTIETALLEANGDGAENPQPEDR